MRLHCDDGNIAWQVWVPGDAPVLRGAIIASMGNNWDYRCFVDRPAWQGAARIWQFALIGTGRKGPKQVAPEKLVPDFDNMLAAAAEQSGRPEFRDLPVCCFGFSLGAGFTHVLSAHRSERVIAAGVGGGGFYPAGDAADAMAFETLKQIPLFAAIGEADRYAAGHWRVGLDGFRAKGARVAFAWLWGLSHYEGNYENAMLVHFDRCIAARLPSRWDPCKGPAKLRDLPLDGGYVGSLAGAEKWTTKHAPAVPAAKYTGETKQTAWLVDEAAARFWQAWVLRHNACCWTRPRLDSVDYIASRELLPPYPAGEPLTLGVAPTWFGRVKDVSFYSGADLLGTATRPGGQPNGEAYELAWTQPSPGVHAVYAVLRNAKGDLCLSKPCPIVVSKPRTASASREAPQ